MRDALDNMTSTIVCPACESEHIEGLPSEGAAGTPEYRCLDCGHEFDASGEPPLSDFDDPDVP